MAIRYNYNIYVTWAELIEREMRDSAQFEFHCARKNNYDVEGRPGTPSGLRGED